MRMGRSELARPVLSQLADAVGKNKFVFCFLFGSFVQPETTIFDRFRLNLRCLEHCAEADGVLGRENEGRAELLQGLSGATALLKVIRTRDFCCHRGE